VLASIGALVSTLGLLGFVFSAMHPRY